MQRGTSCSTCGHILRLAPSWHLPITTGVSNASAHAAVLYRRSPARMHYADISVTRAISVLMFLDSRLQVSCCGCTRLSIMQLPHLPALLVALAFAHPSVASRDVLQTATPPPPYDTGLFAPPPPNGKPTCHTCDAKCTPASKLSQAVSSNVMTCCTSFALSFTALCWSPTGCCERPVRIPLSHFVVCMLALDIADHPWQLSQAAERHAFMLLRLLVYDEH